MGTNFDCYERIYVEQRLIELRDEPIRGSFDIAHLKEVNRYLFQDMPDISEVAAKIYHPGEFRPETPKKKDWIKKRLLTSIGSISIAAYSPMDRPAVERLGKILLDADPARFRISDKDEFVKKLAALYSKLDYIHPFPDGNSRTLREFTRCLSLESGHQLRWEVFNKDDTDRDLLCIARDIAVNKLALANLADDDARRGVYYTLDTFEGNPSLEDLLKDAVTR